jgi:hypothetical protein
MKRGLFSRRAWRFAVLTAAAAVSAFAFVDLKPAGVEVAASQFGPDASYTGAPGESNCTSCHSDFAINSGTGGITISGLPANYRPNQQIPITVRVSQSDAVKYGFQFTMIDSLGRRAGDIAIPNADPPLIQTLEGLVAGNQRRYVEHTAEGTTPTQFGSLSWTFTYTAPPARVGKISFFAAGNAADSNGNTSGDRIYTTSAATLSGSAISTFDNDGVSDVAVFRATEGRWYSRSTGPGGFQFVNWGEVGDKIAPGDYDGDGQTDYVVFRPSTGTWFVQLKTGNISTVHFGQVGDIPVPGDYDGDLKTDIAVYRPTTGFWYWLNSGTPGFNQRNFGVAGDLPAQADFDADGRTDIAVYRPSTGFWYLITSSNNGFVFYNFGVDGDQPVQSDYDGDGRADLAVFRPSNAKWYILHSSLGYTETFFGVPTDLPAPADFDGDGRTDIAVFRDGTWYILGTAGPSYTVTSFGQAGDVPIQRGYLAN